MLTGLIAEGLVVEGELTDGKPTPQYGWAARWAKESQLQAARSKQEQAHARLRDTDVEYEEAHA